MTEQLVTEGEWRRVPLIEVCDVIQGQSPPGDTYNTEGDGLPFFQGKAEFGEYYPTPVKWCTAPKKVAEAGDVLISIRAPVGPTNLCPSQSCIGRGLAALRPKDGVPSKYVLYAIRASVDELVSKATGSTFEAVSGKDLRAHEISLAPLDERPQIVAEIEKQFTRLEAGVAGLRRVQANLKRYRAAVLKAACEGKLVPTEAELARQGKAGKVAAASRRCSSKDNQSRDGSATQEGPGYETGAQLLERILAERREKWNGKGKYKEPVKQDTANLPPPPEGWVWATLDQAFVVERGRFSIRPRNDPRYYDGPHPFVQIGDLPRDGGNILTYSQTLNDEGLKVSKKFQAGAILIAIVGATIANTGILTFDSCCPDSLVAIQSASSVTLRFCEIYLRSIKLRLRSVSYASGGQPNINLSTLLPLPIPFPPLAEQQRIVAEVERRLSVVEELEAVVNANLQRTTRLRQSILQRAFEGRLQGSSNQRLSMEA